MTAPALPHAVVLPTATGVRCAHCPGGAAAAAVLLRRSAQRPAPAT